ncbi:ubiquinone biosynthesis protein COQ9 [Acidiphilium sp. MT5]
MTETEFDSALVSAGFALAGERGWRHVSVAAAARHGGLDLARARRRYRSVMALVLDFGRLADAAALDGAMTDGSVKDRLFDVLMRRIDFLQSHRAGVIALMRMAPFDPGLSLVLARATVQSMGWMLEAAEISARGGRGALRTRGLVAVWAWTIRAWLRDDSEDLSTTMAALDAALTRADQVARGLMMNRRADSHTQDIAPHPHNETPADESPSDDAPLVPPFDDPERPD